MLYHVSSFWTFQDLNKRCTPSQSPFKKNHISVLKHWCLLIFALKPLDPCLPCIPPRTCRWWVLAQFEGPDNLGPTSVEWRCFCPWSTGLLASPWAELRNPHPSVRARRSGESWSPFQWEAASPGAGLVFLKPTVFPIVWLKPSFGWLKSHLFGNKYFATTSQSLYKDWSPSATDAKARVPLSRSAVSHLNMAPEEAYGWEGLPKYILKSQRKWADGPAKTQGSGLWKRSKQKEDDVNFTVPPFIPWLVAMWISAVVRVAWLQFLSSCSMTQCLVIIYIWPLFLPQALKDAEIQAESN